MLMKNLRVTFFATLMLSLTTFAVQADESKQKVVDDYTIHFNTVNTDMLTPEVAKTYNIVRSKNRAFLNVSVRKKLANPVEGGMPDEAVTANIVVKAANLVGQDKGVEMRKIEETDKDGKVNAIYYIGVFSIANDETIKFTITVDPEAQGKATEIKFKQDFYIDN